jgi:hypothetical protein
MARSIPDASKRPRAAAARKQRKSAPWKPIAEELYQVAARQGMHFSGKLTHSNTAGVGVRLPSGAKTGLHYVAVSEVEGVPLDYVKMDTRLSGAWTNLRRHQVDDAAEASAAEVQAIQEALVLASGTAASVGTTSVEKRLRQVVLQDASGNDFCVTPLQSAGLSEVIQRRLREEAERAQSAGKTRTRARGFLGVGGSNPQNIGGLVRSTQRPLWFRAPSEDATVRQALAVHHRGLAVRPSRTRVQAYIDWRAAQVKVHAGVMPASADHRQKEDRFLRDLANDLLRQAETARAKLAAGAKAGLFREGEPSLAASVPVDVAALIEPNRRYAGWQGQIAGRLYDALLATTVRLDGQRVLLPVGQAETVRWIGALEEYIA